MKFVLHSVAPLSQVRFKFRTFKVCCNLSYSLSLSLSLLHSICAVPTTFAWCDQAGDLSHCLLPGEIWKCHLRLQYICPHQNLAKEDLMNAIPFWAMPLFAKMSFRIRLRKSSPFSGIRVRYAIFRRHLVLQDSAPQDAYASNPLLDWQLLTADAQICIDLW